MHLAGDRINAAKAGVRDVAELPAGNFEDYFYRKRRRILRKSNQLLIVDCKRAERRRFTKPIRLRVRSVLWNGGREIFYDEIIACQRCVHLEGFTGNWGARADEFHRN